MGDGLDQVVVVAVHGYGRRNLFTSLLCGGQNRELASHVARHIRAELPAYQTIDDIDEIPKALRGLHPDNPCNLPINGGVQLELPPRVRGLSPLAMFWPSNQDAEGRQTLRAEPAERRRRAMKRFPHVNHLIDGLVKAAADWPG